MMNQYAKRTADFAKALYGDKAGEEIAEGINNSCSLIGYNYLELDADFMELVLKDVTPDLALKCLGAFAKICLKYDLW